MSEIMRINSKEARHDPEKVFAKPEVILDAQGLTRGQKLAALTDWEFNVQSRVDAAAEGMKTSGFAARDSLLLQRIRETKIVLENDDAKL